MRNYQIIIDDIICRWGYSKQYVRQMLAQYKGKHVDMRISSLGGDLDHGLDIRQQLVDHGDVTVYLTGFVASAATIIAMGAKRVCMSKYAMFLVHKCSNFIDAWGNYNADQIQQLIEDLQKNKQENDKIDVVIASLYAQKTGKSINDLLTVLKEGRWLTAQEALDYGFVDELTEDEGESKQNMTSALRQKFNAFGLTTLGLDAEVQEPETRSMLRQILDFVRSLAGNRSEEAAPIVDEAAEPTQPEDVAVVEDAASQSMEAEAPAEESTQNQPTPMNRIVCYSAICGAINTKDLPVNEDGSVTLSQAEMEQINDRLRSLNTQVENLKKQPGDDTIGNLDDTGKAEMSEADMYNLSKSFLD